MSLRRLDSPSYRFSRLTERCLILFVEVSVYSLYFPISHYVAGLTPVDVTTAFDRAVPFKPEWIYVYVAIFYTAFLHLFLVKERHLFRRVGLAYIVVETTALITFVLVPVRMTLRPDFVPGDSFTIWGINFCYYVDLPVNCFPSLHVANAVLGAFACYKVDRLIGSLSFIVGFLIIASTMLVKQHYLADVVAGFALATTAYWFILRPAKTDHIPPSELKYSRIPSALVVVSFFLAILSLYFVYQSGWAPWEAKA